MMNKKVLVRFERRLTPLILKTVTHLILNGVHICFDQNARVLLNKENNPRGSRIFGPVSREVRHNNFTKIISLATEVVLLYDPTIEKSLPKVAIPIRLYWYWKLCR
jgi:hypothetical protein